MSYSNVGGRKGRNIRAHLLVIYGLIDIQLYDIQKCFDEMGYEESHNDLWDVGVKDDKFALIAKLGENAEVVVKTPCGVTDQFNLKRLVM